MGTGRRRWKRNLCAWKPIRMGKGTWVSYWWRIPSANNALQSVRAEVAAHCSCERSHYAEVEWSSCDWMQRNAGVHACVSSYSSRAMGGDVSACWHSYGGTRSFQKWLSSGSICLASCAMEHNNAWSSLLLESLLDKARYQFLKSTYVCNNMERYGTASRVARQVSGRYNQCMCAKRQRIKRNRCPLLQAVGVQR